MFPLMCLPLKNVSDKIPMMCDCRMFHTVVTLNIFYIDVPTDMSLWAVSTDVPLWTVSTDVS